MDVLLIILELRNVKRYVIRIQIAGQMVGLAQLIVRIMMYGKNIESIDVIILELYNQGVVLQI